MYRAIHTEYCAAATNWFDQHAGILSVFTFLFWASFIALLTFSLRHFAVRCKNDPWLGAAGICTLFGACVALAAHADLRLSISDAVEYFSVAHFAAVGDTPCINLSGSFYPARYSPWFSLVFLEPLYTLFGLSPENLGVVLSLCAVCAVWFGFLAAAETGGMMAGVIAASLMVLLPEFRYFAQFPMTEIPSVMLCAGILYLAVAAGGRAWLKLSVLGIILAMLVGMRPMLVWVFIPLLSQVLREARAKAASALLLLLPTCGLLLHSIFYNRHVFGAWDRSGYQFWLAVPYDYFSLVFSPSYMIENASLVFSSSFALLFMMLCAVPLVFRGERGQWSLPILYAFVALGASLLTFLPYFYGTSRFYLPAGIFAAIALAGIGGRLLPRRNWLAFLPLWLVLFALLPRQENVDRRVKEQVEVLPENVTLITGRNIAMLSLRHREDVALVPISRRPDVEYASKIIATRRVARLDPPPRDARDHRAPALLKEEAVHEVFSTVAIDAPPVRGERIFVDTSAVTEEEMGILRQHFTPILFSRDIVELRRSEPVSAQ